MRNTFQSFSTFISSPSDVKDEREITKDVITKINNNIRDTLHLNFHILSWDELPPETPALSEESIQDRLNQFVKRSHFFVLILHKRYGTVERGHDKSNTEREIDTILELNKINPKIKILSYFKDTGKENPDPGEQEIKVNILKNRLEKQGVHYKKFVNITDFREKIIHDLYNLALKLKMSPYKSECLQNFWNIGGNHGRQQVDLALLYRPLSRELIDKSILQDYWLRRLMPAVAFEDAKAIQKIQKNMRLIGVRSKVYTSAESPANLKLFSRVWICAPRITQAQHQLQKYTDERRFQFKKQRGKDATLVWTSSDGALINIRSPLAKYLSTQRVDGGEPVDWNGRLSNIFAKDYAIIARFDDLDEKYEDGSCPKDFFIAGIRGLGTWGAAWYLDRKYEELKKIKDNTNVQILLEINYKNGMILDVFDVSEKNQNYFLDENRIRTVRTHVRDHIHGGIPL